MGAVSEDKKMQVFLRGVGHGKPLRKVVERKKRNARGQDKCLTENWDASFEKK